MTTIQATSTLKVDPNEPPLEMQGMAMIPMTIATKFTVETSDRPWENKSAQGSPQSVR